MNCFQSKCFVRLFKQLIWKSSFLLPLLNDRCADPIEIICFPIEIFWWPPQTGREQVSEVFHCSLDYRKTFSVLFSILWDDLFILPKTLKAKTRDRFLLCNVPNMHSVKMTAVPSRREFIMHFCFCWTESPRWPCLSRSNCITLGLKYEQEINHLQIKWWKKTPTQSMCQNGSIRDLKVIRFPGGLLLHMQYKLYKPPARQLGGTSNSCSCKPHF